MTTPAPSLLVVEDDERLRSRLVCAFRDRGYETREAGDHTAALAAAREDSPEYMLVDLRLPGPSGLEVIRSIKSIDPGTTVVILTGYGSIATAIEAVRLGAADYLTKPADVDAIVAAFARAERVTLQPPSGAETSVPSLARVEWEHVNRVVTDCGGNVSKAARLLGIHRRTLQRKLAKYPNPR
jgi:two-component system, response regulator RegA